MAKNPENMTLEELREQQLKIAQLLESAEKDALVEFEEAVKKLGFEKFGDRWEKYSFKLVPKAGTGTGKGRSDKGKTLPDKYRDEEGNTWSGRGQLPKVWSEKGLTLDDVKKRFTIDKQIAEGRKQRK